MDETNNKPRRVDFFQYDEDFEVAYMGSLGFSTRAIIMRTKLSAGKVTYRLKKAHIKRMDYRNGDSDIAILVDHSLRGAIVKNLSSYLKTI